MTDEIENADRQQSCIKHTQRQRERDRETYRERERERERRREKERERERERDRDIDTVRQAERDRQRDSETDSERQTKRDTKTKECNIAHTRIILQQQISKATQHHHPCLIRLCNTSNTPPSPTPREIASKRNESHG